MGDVAWEELPALETVLVESVEAVKRREATELDELLRASGGRCVVFGAGTLGRKAVGLLREIGVNPIALSDSDPKRWGDMVEGLKVISPQDAVKTFGIDAVFFVTIWNDFHWYKATEAKLTRLGCLMVSSYAPLFWRFGGRFMELHLLNEAPHGVYEQREAVLAAEKIWADEESVGTYRANVMWRALGDASGMPYPALQNTYLPVDLVALRQDEVIVDCGAFDGDTIRMTLESVGDGFGKVYAIEADATSLKRLGEYLKTLPDATRAKVETMECAVGAERGTIRFSGDGSLTSKAGDAGNDVECLPIDELFATTHVTFVKMDIEGAEYGALLGARKVIARDRPVLAVCVYHTQSDVWRIPLLVREMVPGYELFLRSYDGDGFQTVLYAVPEERLLAETERGIAPRKVDEIAGPEGTTARKKSLRQRVKEMFPAGQMLRYLCVGGFNTLFSYISYAVVLTMLNGTLPQKYLYLTVVLASAIVTPVNITVAFLGYKFMVFRTKGHFLSEWAKCFAVYGAGWIPGLFTLSAITKGLQVMIHRYNAPLRVGLVAVEAHLNGAPRRWLEHAATGRAAAGYVSGFLMIFFATVYSFLGHKHVTFKRKG